MPSGGGIRNKPLLNLGRGGGCLRRPGQVGGLGSTRETLHARQGVWSLVLAGDVQIGDSGGGRGRSQGGRELWGGALESVSHIQRWSCDPQVAQQCWRSWLQGPAATPTGAVSFSRTDKVQEAEGLEAGGWHGLGYRRGQAKKISIHRARGAGGKEDEKPGHRAGACYGVENGRWERRPKAKVTSGIPSQSRQGECELFHCRMNQSLHERTTPKPLKPWPLHSVALGAFISLFGGYCWLLS